MALVVKDRVRQTSNSSGTGAMTLGATPAGFQSFAAIGSGNTTYYTIVESNTGAWEVGIGTYNGATNTLSRDTVLDSSNSGSLVNFSLNAKDVFCTYPAGRSVDSDTPKTLTNKTISGSANTINNISLTTAVTGTLPVSNGGTGATSLSGYVKGNGTGAFTSSASVPTSDISGTLAVANGGTGQTSYTDGQLLIGNTATGGLNKATLTAGSNVTITNGNGTITVASTNPGGDVVGPSSATDNAVVRFDGTTGKLVQNSSVVVDDSGNVGIGTSSPTVPLTVGPSTLPAGVSIAGQLITSETAATTPIFSVRRSAASGNAVIAQYTSSGTAASPTVVALDRGLGRNSWYGFDGTNYIEAAFIAASVDATPGTNDMPGRMVFATTADGASTPTERMRITSAGNVGIGTAAPATPLHVNGTIRYTNRPAAGTITAIGYDANGDLKNSSSSLRYKHEIQDYGKGLAEVMQLRPVSFKFNGEERTNIGYIAEEVDALGLSEVMLYDEQGRAEGVLYANMVSLLTKAIQEQQTQIEELKQRIEALENNRN